MTSWAKPGVKCVCIKQGAWRNAAAGCLEYRRPSFNELCEVESVTTGRLGVYLKLVGYADLYAPVRFLPLITKTQEEDVSMFLELLQKQEEPA